MQLFGIEKLIDSGSAKPKTTAATSFAFGRNAVPEARKRRMSAVGRARIAAAQKAGWAKVKAAKK